MAQNMWLAPASTANLQKSILQTVNTPAGPKHAWAMNARHVNNYATLAAGDLVLFGNAELGYKWVAEVTEKPENITGIEWPYNSPSGAPWSNVFYVDQVTELTKALTPKDIRDTIGAAMANTQYKLKPLAAEKMAKTIASRI